MTRFRKFATTATLGLLTLVAPSFVLSGSRAAGPPFKLRVVDRSGQPITGVSVVADNGLRCRTNANGETWWSEASIRRRGVRFELQGPHVATTVAMVDVVGGTLETVTADRRQSSGL